jgi:hypothetical protein
MMGLEKGDLLIQVTTRTSLTIYAEYAPNLTLHRLGSSLNYFDFQLYLISCLKII